MSNKATEPIKGRVKRRHGDSLDVRGRKRPDTMLDWASSPLCIIASFQQNPMTTIP
jgi:hypothetical protein